MALRNFISSIAAFAFLASVAISAAANPKVSAEPKQKVMSLQIDAGPQSVSALVLRGADAKQQMLVTAKLEDGSLRDHTRAVKFEVKPANVVKVDATGFVTPINDGTATITAKGPDGMKTTLPVKVEKSKAVTPINFGNQVVPIFTKTGCNGGGCHGKSGGQNGFMLSLLGFEPTEDYEHLVKEARGRRLFPAAPDRSLLLMKGTAALPHGGGKRLDSNSDDYRLLVRWINQGMPYGRTNDAVLDHIEVQPKERVLP